MKLAIFILFISSVIVAAAIKPEEIVKAARSQIGVTTGYDPAYRRIAYPGGDVPKQSGVCSDVVIRALRPLGIDLQKEVHEDMVHHFSKYPQKWGLAKPDANIDHRRVPNLMTYFQRRGYGLATSKTADDYKPGDIVAWDLGKGLTHIGIVSDRKTAQGIPQLIHNIGQGAIEADILFEYKIIGHYRLK